MPLFVTYGIEEKEIALDCIKIFTRLTMPLPSGDDDDEPINIVEQTRQLCYFKELFLKRGVCTTLLAWVEGSIEEFTSTSKQQSRSSTVSDRALADLELFVTLIRNLLRIPNVPDAMKDSQRFLNDRLIMCLDEEYVLETLIALGSHINVNEVSAFNTILMETLHFLFQYESAESLLGTDDSLSSSSSSSSSSHKSIAASKLAATLHAHQRKRSDALRSASSRHSRFGGTIKRTNMLGGVTMTHDPFLENRMPNASKNSSALYRKPNLKGHAKRQYMSDKVRQILVANATALLKQQIFSNLFQNVYRQVRTSAISIHRTMWFARFAGFMCEFHRALQKTNNATAVRRGLRKLEADKKLDAEQRKQRKQKLKDSQKSYFEAIDVFPCVRHSFFEWLTTRLTELCDSKPINWDLIEAIVFMLKEHICLVYEMSSYGNDKNKKDGHKLLHQIAYQISILRPMIELIKRYKPYLQTRKFMLDVVYTNHYLLKLLKTLTKENMLLVQEKRRKKKKKKTKKPTTGAGADASASASASADVGAEAKVEVVAEVVAPRVRTAEEVLQSSDDEADPENQVAAATVSASVSDSANAAAASSSASAAASAPNNAPIDASLDGDAEMKDANPMHVDSDAVIEAKVDESDTLVIDVDEEDANDGDQEDIDLGLDDDADEYEVVTKETAFDYVSWVSRYAHPKIIDAYMYILGGYKDNSAATNHCLLRLLNTIAVDLKLPAMLYQLSIFQLFEEVLADKSLKRDSRCMELYSFSKYITRSFFADTAKNPLLFVEILFWKNSRDADVAVDPKAHFQQKIDHRMAELLPQSRAYDQYDDDEEEEAGLGGDIEQFKADAEAVLLNRQRLRGRWSPEEDQMLRDNFEEFQNDDACWEILSTLIPGRSADAIERRAHKLKLLHTRPRVRKADKKRQQPNDGDDDDDDDDADADESESEQEAVFEAPPSASASAAISDGDDDDAEAEYSGPMQVDESHDSRPKKKKTNKAKKAKKKTKSKSKSKSKSSSKSSNNDKEDSKADEAVEQPLNAVFLQKVCKHVKKLRKSTFMDEPVDWLIENMNRCIDIRREQASSSSSSPSEEAGFEPYVMIAADETEAQFLQHKSVTKLLSLCGCTSSPMPDDESQVQWSIGRDATPEILSWLCRHVHQAIGIANTTAAAAAAAAAAVSTAAATSSAVAEDTAAAEDAAPSTADNAVDDSQQHSSSEEKMDSQQKPKKKRLRKLKRSHAQSVVSDSGESLPASQNTAVDEPAMLHTQESNAGDAAVLPDEQQPNETVTVSDSPSAPVKPRKATRGIFDSDDEDEHEEEDDDENGGAFKPSPAVHARKRRKHIMEDSDSDSEAESEPGPVAESDNAGSDTVSAPDVEMTTTV
jgi:Timeless protein/Myb-like DNA-binding domain